MQTVSRQKVISFPGRTTFNSHLSDFATAAASSNSAFSCVMWRNLAALGNAIRSSTFGGKQREAKHQQQGNGDLHPTVLSYECPRD